ncbi:hypothetical protein SAMN04487837_0201 [Streptococcus equinus]|uniref:hypothetical protein n=1 Tax=Streptococcus equinus TaxID=1335 RepID=UPI00051B45D5|nr:hypothetical protein [Streptococcus equinus]TFH45795.1 hypothetical protein E3305_06250 [Streptococcus equinus]SCW37945.1 hypothetical protein SAMN02910449_0872 [Streptococcus equinus]SDQ02963.1 hypothetical protein SAMN04487837_0201 [Streptococcus equinus]SEK58884.1 hypothetical protein SAMN04487838_1308 [Streptococcus equinus]
MSILPECLAFLGNLLSLIIFGILFQEITKNKLSIAEWVIYGVEKENDNDYKFTQALSIFEKENRE